ncbi:nucleoside 2-deoxyribosyltransferase [Anoxybacteroides tepidamans]|uniref:nucleoside 2-deoxyribosyltransferase n=1 Tax=Anoxybacteroides tepidamans TaxID=265948 RepID=UPI000481EF5B|nr:nucleoside 2-deoxyribosyltransferase [Anoxybacillus tepidamans]
MKFYIASSFVNKEAVRVCARRLIERGFTQTYDWTENERASTIEQLLKVGEEERQAVMAADFFVILLPAGKGSHVELGIALASGKRVYMYSPDEEIYDPTTTATFYHLPEVQKFVGTLDAFVEQLILCEAKKQEIINEKKQAKC